MRRQDADVARMLGTSRSSVNKSLRELERFGAIEVKDAALLQQACGRAAGSA